MNRWAVLAFVALGLIWGSNFIFMQWAGLWISAEQIVLVRVLFGFLPLLAFALWRGALQWQHWRYLHHFVVMGVLASSLYYYAFAAGTLLLPSSIAGILSGAIPLFATLASWLFIPKEPIHRSTLWGLALGYMGVLLVARPWQLGDGALSLAGIAYILFGSLSLGLSFVYARRFLSQAPISSVALATYQSAISLLLLWIVTDINGIELILQDTRALLAATVGLGLLGTGVAFVLYYVVVQQLGAVMAASTTYLPPMVALWIGFALGESIGVWDCMAMGLILMGVAKMHWGQRQVQAT